MGTEIETFRTQRARRRWGEPPKDRDGSLNRTWSAVRKARVVWGLAVASIFPCAAFWLSISLTLERDRILLHGFLSTGILALCWFIGVGALFLSWLGRTYGTVGRFNCLALCATLSFSLPLISALIGTASSLPGNLIEGLATIPGGAAVGLLFAPLGIFSGWVLWRIAIRAAAIPLQEIAQAF
jgi:hypothetical protein